MKRQLWFTLTVGLFTSMLLPGQDTSEPDPCGPGFRRQLPQNFSVLIDKGGGPARIRFRLKDSSVDIEFPSVTDEFREACQISDQRLLVFGVVAGPPLYHVGIVDSQNGVLVDSFYAYSPALSPGKRWLIMRRFYPPHAGVDFSEQYFIYDMQKSPAENRIAYADEPSLGDAVGTLIYPVEANNKPYEHVNLQDSEIHSFSSHGFYWSMDSKAVAFADSTRDGLSLVLVSIRDNVFRTYVHLLSVNDVCSPPIKSQRIPYLLLSSAQLTPSSNGTYDVHAELSAGGSMPGCQAKPIDLAEKDFEPAKLQRHPQPPPRPALTRVPKPN
jgi:hypothetical protein